MYGQSSKKSRNSESSGNSSGSGVEFVSSSQIFRSPQPSRLGTSPPSTASKGRATSKRCPRCHQFHTGPYSASQVCYQCGQTDHVRKFCPMSNTTASVEQTLGQPRALAVSSDRVARKPSRLIKSAAESSSRVQSTQRPQQTQTHIFVMITAEVQANSDSITGIIFVFGEPA